jgi:hypothetical protein
MRLPFIRGQRVADGKQSVNFPRRYGVKRTEPYTSTLLRHAGSAIERNPYVGRVLAPVTGTRGNKRRDGVALSVERCAAGVLAWSGLKASGAFQGARRR